MDGATSRTHHNNETHPSSHYCFPPRSSLLPAITPVINSTNETVIGSNDGTAHVSVSGGVPQFIYYWSSGQTTDSISQLSPGIYTVTVIDLAGCSASASVTIESGPTTTTASENEIRFTCFPNPASDRLTILVDEKAIGAALNIYDAAGKCISQAIVSEAVMTIPLQEYSAGCYVAELRTATWLKRLRWVKVN